MTTMYADKVSMLADGELQGSEADEIIQCLGRDEELKRCWEIQHLIGEAVRNELPRAIQPDFARRVATLIEQEPIYLNPRITPSTATQPGFTRSNNVVGFALAASISAISVVGLLQFNEQRSSAEPFPVASVATAPQMVAQVEPGLESVAFRVVEDGAEKVVYINSPRNQQQAAVSYPTEAADLYDYLVNYNRYAAAFDHQESPLSPSISVVSYDPWN